MPTILMTGVSSGIGLACAERFAREGWKVIGTVRDPARVTREWPGDVTLMALDLGSAESVRALGAAVLDELGGAPDVLLNNAGTLEFGPIEFAQDSWRDIFEVNVFGNLELIKALLPAMRERGSGVIATVTSLGGRLTFPFYGTYNASKWAMEGYSEGLWHELKPFGIRVKAIEPGYVDTKIFTQALGDAPGAEIDPDSPYAPYERSMDHFSRTVDRQSTPAEAADEVFAAVTDTSDRLRYPIAAWAKLLLRARRVFGEQLFMENFHKRWLYGETDDVTADVLGADEGE
jgi:NAD(P)-dependent dehydrogenase (short-subunit alcohol dehydrogenase family)